MSVLLFRFNDSIRDFAYGSEIKVYALNAREVTTRNTGHLVGVLAHGHSPPPPPGHAWVSMIPPEAGEYES